MFWPAWQQAFSEKNIASAYKKTGIFPFDPELLLHAISKPTTTATSLEPPLEPSRPKTPLTSHDVRRLQRQYRQAPSSALVIKAFNANATLAAQHSIDTHTIYALQIQLANEKRKRKKGKKLDLCGDEAHAGAQFFSPNKIQRARDYNEAKEAQKAQEIQDIAARKEAREATKKINDTAKKARSLAYRDRVTKNAAIRAEKAAATKARKEATQRAKEQRAQPKRAQCQEKRPKKALKTTNNSKPGPVDATAPAEVEEVIQVTSRGRRVAPHRFRTQ